MKTLWFSHLREVLATSTLGEYMLGKLCRDNAAGGAGNQGDTDPSFAQPSKREYASLRVAKKQRAIIGPGEHGHECQVPLFAFAPDRYH
jgi:hypothetical protein